MSGQTKVKPFLEKNDDLQTLEVEKLFRPLTTCLQVVGTYVPQRRKRILRIVQCIYCAVVMSAYFFNIVRAGFLFRGKSDLGGLLIFSSFFIMHLGFGNLAFGNLILTSRNLGPFLEALTNYHEKHGYAYNKGKFLATVKITTLLSFLISFTVCTALVYIWSQPGTSLKNTVLAFTESSQMSAIIALVAIGLILLYAIWMTLTTVIAFGMVCFILNREFTSVNERVLCVTKTGLVDDELEDVRLQHNEIAALLKRANTFITHILFSHIAAGLPITFLLLYGIIMEPLSKAETTAVSIAVALTPCLIFGLIIGAALLNFKAHACLDDLVNFDLRKVSARAAHTITVFISRLQGPNIGFHVYGIFTIDTSTILTITGTLCTYAVVLLQLKPAEPS